MPDRILVVEDEKNMQFFIVEAMKNSKYVVEGTASAEEALRKIECFIPDVIITDINLPGISGFEFISQVKKIHPYIPIIVITALSSREYALEAIQKGAYDFFTKPCKLAEVEVVVKRALEKSKLQQKLSEMQERLDEKYRLSNIVGQSGKMREISYLIEKVAPTDATVLIIGESGTGKEMVSEAIFNNSLRKEQPFIKLNCAAIPAGLLESELFGHEKGAFTGAINKKVGKFELAHQGTIFLDEIGDMPLEAQAKVLRVIQEKIFERVGGSQPTPVDVRIIAATNKALAQEVKKGLFREDLFYRLNVFPIVIPPLRERAEDIPILAEHFINKITRKNGSRVKGITEEALSYLKKYNWPGNVRELENTIERAIILSNEEYLTPSCFPSYLQTIQHPAQSSPLDKLVEDIEKNFIVDALQKSGWVQTKAAKLLGITERSLWHRVKKYQIKIPENLMENRDIPAL
ncbi:MAG: sigma-54 dependent transcriptional regulator [Candidatus Brocadiales bacterium]|nr:sigma-54 dependent transcriptional regulator [Candidatus Brocadiales bacterium]